MPPAKNENSPNPVFLYFVDLSKGDIRKEFDGHGREKLELNLAKIRHRFIEEYIVTELNNKFLEGSDRPIKKDPLAEYIENILKHVAYTKILYLYGIGYCTLSFDNTAYQFLAKYSH